LSKGWRRRCEDSLGDRIYITTMFSFHWPETIKTVKYYEFSVRDPKNFFIGGPKATLMANKIQKETGFNLFGSYSPPLAAG
jgi:hypothetical protein